MGGSSKSSVVGYRYFMDLMFGLCYGPVDRVRALIVGDRRAWDGTQDENGIIEVDKPELFGGDEREGGVVGQVQVLMGAGDQALPDFASSRLPTPSPAFRGTLTALYSGQISANNPYVKPFAWQVERILSGWHGGAAWLPEKAPIPLSGTGSASAELELIMEAIGSASTVSVDFYNVPGTPPTNATQLLPGIEFFPYQTNGAFSNLSAHVRAADVPALPANFAIELEYKTLSPEASTAAYLVSRTNDDAGGSVFAWAISSGSGSVTFTAPSIFASGVSLGMPAENDGEWHTYKVVKIGTSISTYLDGVLQETEACFAGGVSDVSAPLSINGKYQTTGLPNTWGSDAQTSSYRNVRIYGIDAQNIADYVAMNPAHMIYQCLTDPVWGMGYPTSQIGDTFEAAANVLFDEGFGLCMQWARQEEIGAFVRQILDHAGGILYVDPKTGLFELKLLRGDYDAGTLPVFDETNIEALESFQRVGYGELVNEIVVVFRDVATNRDTPVAVQNLAAIQAQGGVVSATKQYPGIPIAPLALRVAQRDLMTASTPLAKARIKINREAWSLAPGAVFRLNWPKLGVDQIVVRVIGIDYGTLEDGMITAEVAEDVFGLPAASYAQQEDGDQGGGSGAAKTRPQPVTAQTMVEIPYRSLAAELSAGELAGLDADAAYFAAVAAEPTATSQNFNIWSRVGDAAYVQSSVGNFSPAAELAANISPGATTISLQAGVNLSQVQANTLAIIGAGRAAEWVLVKSINIGTPSITVARGMLDTTPAAHLAGASVFFDDGRDAPELVERATGETVDMKLQTISTGGTLDLGGAPIMTATAQQRQARPYAPGNVLINGLAFPTLIDGEPEIEVTWSHRDRKQQTAGFIEQDDGSIGPEAGTVYSLELIDTSDDSLLDFAQRINATSHVFSGLPTGSIDVKLRLWAERGTQGPTTAVAVTATITLLAAHGGSTAQSIRFDFSGTPVPTEQYRIELLQGGRTIIVYAGNKSALSDLTESFAENIEADPQYTATRTSTSVTITASAVNVPFTYSYGGTGLAYGAPYIESWQAQEREFTWDVVAPPPPISFVGQTSSSTGGQTSIAAPTHAAGDLLILIERGSSASVPSTPSGWTSIITDPVAGGIGNGYRVSYKVDADNTVSTIATTINSHRIVLAYRGASGIGASALSAYDLGPTSETLPSLTLDAGGDSWVLGVVSINQSDTIAATTMTSRASLTGTLGLMGADSAGPVSSVSGGGTWSTAAYVSSVAIELLQA